MDGSETPPPRGEAAGALSLRAVEFPAGQGVLKACQEDVGWRDAGDPCPAPAWTPERQSPIVLTLGESVVVAISLAPHEGGGGPGAVEITGAGPGVIRFRREGVSLTGRSARVEMTSSRPLPKRVAKITLGIDWAAGDGEAVSPARTENVAYVVMGRAGPERGPPAEESGITLKRMDRAVSWVEPIRSLQPHAIVRALMARFPYYSLRPNPKVPRKFHHPTYFNNQGGAWAMSDYPEESGECQAIVRLVRGILRQIGVPGEARTVLVWADPDVEGGKKALSAYWDEDPGAGLSRSRIVHGKRWIAALSDAPLQEGKEYPASHTVLPGGRISPGLNRYEACLEFTHGGVTLDYGGGAGVFRGRDDVIRAFWGLVWVSPAPHEGFRVEQIVTRY